ncbi:GNAT family N-acetyltransferase [Streptomyces sp. MS2.AVA.5]|uniref:GNAT family N-acetyltransferase n=1 Tax=Streptomyces achmelvichensis TaxID=3134111 RepID=A0ACC6PKE2_9ACTN
MPAESLPRLDHVQVGPDPGGKDARRLEARHDGTLVAEAVVGIPQEGIGVLLWISVEPSARGRGLGRAMLGSALDTLRRAGGPGSDPLRGRRRPTRRRTGPDSGQLPLRISRIHRSRPPVFVLDVVRKQTSRTIRGCALLPPTLHVHHSEHCHPQNTSNSPTLVASRPR